MRTYYLEAAVAGNPASLVAPVREALAAADPGLLLNEVTTLPARMARDTSRERVVAYLSSSFAALTLLLASVGLYGVLAYDVTRRTKEIGVRMALGAVPAALRWSILSRGLAITGAGVGIGLGGAAALAPALRALLFGVSPLSVSTFLLVPLVFLLASIVASFVPARRATRVDPLVALRSE
jgi:ABC-type antimicrobial peptide transport system permease subunit